MTKTDDVAREMVQNPRATQKANAVKPDAVDQAAQRHFGAEARKANPSAFAPKSRGRRPGKKAT